MAEEQKIKQKTREGLIDELILLDEQKNLSFYGNKEQERGDLDFVTFLEKIWPLSEIESGVSKNPTAYSLIMRKIGFQDWDYKYVLYKYLGIITDSDEVFFRFVEQIVHPNTCIHSEQEALVEIINRHITKDRFILKKEGEIAGLPYYKIESTTLEVKQKIKNLIFAAHYKPDIAMEDIISNKIKLEKKPEHYLVLEEGEDDLFLEDLESHGLSWNRLVGWWKKYMNHPDISDEQSATELSNRLRQSLPRNSPPEKTLWETYLKEFCQKADSGFPALIPQVYFHYDPKTFEELEREKRLVRQRMDFLLLLPHRVRIVIEVDGVQHYSKKLFKVTERVLTKLREEEIPDGVLRIVTSLNDPIYQEEEFYHQLERIIIEKYRVKVLEYAFYKNEACPEKYAEMVNADRQLRIKGYEIYRFGGKEVNEGIVKDFFYQLFNSHQIAILARK